LNKRPGSDLSGLILEPYKQDTLLLSPNPEISRVQTTPLRHSAHYPNINEGQKKPQVTLLFLFLTKYHI
jgi:hypothetical protein